ncbi:transcription factor E2F6 isoform X2 [Girardinichthys multiradiatus]|uniref:transcription factor E2F6 isoform X2 n=1 Tax=Girardinichthys multiradiatus TaxID=208333 RepID=UPI001FAC8417|nr:transcription factor E2F6 isoform X2 [Girardinichthys multiradiatus]
MVKCVVSGCPNRVEGSNRGTFNRTQKRFFKFPGDPARVKVWLAALRQTDQKDSSDQNLICEDHFLPEDISSNEVSADAIPIMPPCLDGPLGMMDPWGVGSEEEEEDQWPAGAAGTDEEYEDEGGSSLPFNTKLALPELPPLDSPEQDSGLKAAPGRSTLNISQHQQEQLVPAKIQTREETSLPVLTRRFLDLFLNAPDGSLDLRHAITSLKTRRRRVYDITNVLQGIQLIEKESVNRIKWIGSCPVSSYLGQNQALPEMTDLKLVEETLDSLIRSCAQQLFDLTDDPENSALAYVTYEDLRRLKTFQEQTVMVVKAPEETKLEVPAPTEDSIQIHLKGGAGPILVMTCDIGTEGGSRETSGCFLSLEDSRIKTAELHTGTMEN